MQDEILHRLFLVHHIRVVSWRSRSSCLHLSCIAKQRLDQLTGVNDADAAPLAVYDSSQGFVFGLQTEQRGQMGGVLANLDQWSYCPRPIGIRQMYVNDTDVAVDLAIGATCH